MASRSAKKRASPCAPSRTRPSTFSMVTDPPRTAAAAAGYVAAVTSPGMRTFRARSLPSRTVISLPLRSIRAPRARSAATVMATNGSETSVPVIRRWRPPASRGATSSRADANWLDSFPPIVTPPPLMGPTIVIGKLSPLTLAPRSRRACASGAIGRSRMRGEPVIVTKPLPRAASAAAKRATVPASCASIAPPSRRRPLAPCTTSSPPSRSTR